MNHKFRLKKQEFFHYKNFPRISGNSGNTASFSLKRMSGFPVQGTPGGYPRL